MENKVYIVGAHSRGRTLARYLQYLYPGTTVEAYLYDNDEKNPENIEGTNVFYLSNGVELYTDYPVFIGTRSIYHPCVTAHLRQRGFTKIYPVTVGMDLRLRNAYLKKYYTSIGKSFFKIGGLPVMDSANTGKGKAESKKPAKIYVARSVFDKPFQQVYELKTYEKEIQAGAALVKERLCDGGLTDDSGEHISNRNRQFCELTALYWIWKNTKEDIIGLEHYRRHFILPDDWVERMECHKIDVILPVPLYVAPSLEENYKMRHDPSEWDYMLQCMETDDRQLYQEAREFFKGNLYSPCNMFIMRKEVLDDLCAWLFPILFRVADHGEQKEDPYQNRYPGFLSERLITFFFEKNSKKYHVVYADKNFLS